MNFNKVQKINGKFKGGIGLFKKQGFVPFTKEASQYLFWESLGYKVVLP
jgi:hypothetical protein